MDKQVEVKKIVIRIGDKEATLTPGDAKALRDVLNEMFGEKEKEYIPYPYSVPYVVPFTFNYPYWYKTVVTCENTDRILCISANSDTLSSLG